MRFTTLVSLLVLLVAPLALAAISNDDVLVEVSALVARIGSYSADHPDAAGAFKPWTGRTVAYETPLLIHSYPTLEPAYYYVPITSKNGDASFVTLGADDGVWQAFGHQHGAPLVQVDRSRAAAELGKALDTHVDGDDVRIVSMPDKHLYWHAGTPGDREAFVDLSDPTSIRIGLDKTIAPAQPRLPTPPANAGLGFGSTNGDGATDTRDRYPASYNIQDVPFHYQGTSYNCGPAASEMVMDYWGPDIYQEDVADVANCGPSVGSYADDVRRTGHFSTVSSAVQNASLQGYNERGIGYGALDCWWSNPDTGDPDYPTRYSDLKTLISSDYPVLVLTHYDTSHNSGHFRVIKGYDDNTNVFIVHDPWYSAPYQGPNVQFTQATFVDNLWTRWYRWRTLISPWEIDIDAPDGVLGGTQFTVSATVTYRGPHPFDGQNSAASPTATIDTSPLFTLATGETATKSLSLSTSNTSSTVSWQLDAPEELLGNIIGVMARGLISDSSTSYPSYSDSIGGQAWHPITIHDASLIIVDRSGTGHFETIQEGLTYADSGDTVEVRSGVYTGSQNRDLHFGGKAIVLRSQAGADVTVIDCLFEGRGLDMRSGETASTVIDGFTVRYGLATGTSYPENSGGGMILIGSSPTIRNMVFAYNQAPNAAGGIACLDYSSPYLWNVEFRGNVAESNGGGGMLAYSHSNPSLIECLFDNNNSEICGGGLWAYFLSAPTVEHCTFVNNTATLHGGAIACGQESPATIENCTLYANLAPNAGGIDLDDSAALIRNTIISWSVAGPAVQCSGTNPTFSHNNIYGNAGGDNLCGIYAGLGNIYEDPLFCDAANDDFTLEDCSPCIGAG
ncbi:right-handed parallel beta-helix repeat-containing protein, partial [bacterium]|nr:right-handed parallel beta-helix repeat-containing protein [bacterium]